MAFGKDTQVSMMMGFPAVADKIQETDRLRGYENTYVTISEVKKECLDGVKITLEDGEALVVSNEQMILTAIGWKQAADIKKEPAIPDNASKVQTISIRKNRRGL